MGLRDKVALFLTIVLVTQVMISYCVQSASRKATLQRYLEARGIKAIKSDVDNYNKVKKHNIANTLSKSMYKAYNFPETEYPLDSCPGDPFYLSVNSQQCFPEKQIRNPQLKAVEDLRKDIKMKRKLKRLSEDDHTTKGAPSYTNLMLSESEPICFKDQEMFPEVQYPLKAMDIWAPQFWKSPEKSKLPFKSCKGRLKTKLEVFMDELDKIREKLQNSKSNTKVIDTKALNCTEAKTNCFPKSGSDTDDLINPDSPNLSHAAMDCETMLMSKMFDDENSERIFDVTASNKREIVPKKQSDCTTTAPEKIGQKILEIDSNKSSVTPLPLPYRILQETIKNPCVKVDKVKTEENNNFKDNLKRPSLLETEENLDNLKCSKNKLPFGKELCLVSTDTMANTSDDLQTQWNAKPANDSVSDTSPKKNDTLLPVSPNLNEIILNSDTPNTTTLKNHELNQTDDTLNTEIPLITADKNVTVLQHGTSDKDKQVPHVTVIIAPEGNSVNNIHLPMTATNTDSPIVVLITTNPSDVNTILLTNTSNTCPVVVETVSNVSLTSIPNLACYVPTQNTTSDIVTVPVDNILVIPDFEMLPNNSMCYISQDKVKQMNNMSSNLTCIENAIPISSLMDVSSYNAFLNSILDNVAIPVNNSDIYLLSCSNHDQLSLKNNTQVSDANQNTLNNEILAKNNDELFNANNKTLDVLGLPIISQDYQCLNNDVTHSISPLTNENKDFNMDNIDRPFVNDILPNILPPSDNDDSHEFIPVNQALTEVPSTKLPENDKLDLPDPCLVEDDNLIQETSVTDIPPDDYLALSAIDRVVPGITPTKATIKLSDELTSKIINDKVANGIDNNKKPVATDSDHLPTLKDKSDNVMYVDKTLPEENSCSLVKELATHEILESLGNKAIRDVSTPTKENIWLVNTVNALSDLLKYLYLAVSA